MSFLVYQISRLFKPYYECRTCISHLKKFIKIHKNSNKLKGSIKNLKENLKRNIHSLKFTKIRFCYATINAMDNQRSI
jgi:hypothetical protein